MAGVTSGDAMKTIVLHMSGDFEWGVNDCCRSACLAFHSLWGVDPMHGCPEYSGPKGAYKFMANFGGLNSASNNVATMAGLVETRADPGMLCVSWINPRRWAAGLCIDGHNVAFKSNKGFSIMSVTNGKFWGVPCPQ